MFSAADEIRKGDLDQAFVAPGSRSSPGQREVRERSEGGGGLDDSNAMHAYRVTGVVVMSA